MFPALDACSPESDETAINAEKSTPTNATTVKPFFTSLRLRLPASFITPTIRSRATDALSIVEPAPSRFAPNLLNSPIANRIDIRLVTAASRVSMIIGSFVLSIWDNLFKVIAKINSPAEMEIIEAEILNEDPSLLISAMASDRPAIKPIRAPIAFIASHIFVLSIEVSTKIDTAKIAIAFATFNIKSEIAVIFFD